VTPSNAVPRTATVGIVRDEPPLRERVVKALQSRGRVSEHVGEDSREGVQADLENLRAAARELQDAVLILAEELGKRG
jgi:hypothetical protein